MSLAELQERGEAPAWLTEEGYKSLSSGYLLPGETPRSLYRRLSIRAASILSRLEIEDLESKFFNMFWRNWFCPASPIAANFGTDRGLPISCYGLHIPDSVDGIMSSMHEVSMLTKGGGGIGTYWGEVRARGSKISGNGRSNGIVPFLKILDSVTAGINQGDTRKGASSAYLPIEHGDFDEFMRIRRPEGDINLQCPNIHHAISIGDDFMNSVLNGDIDARNKWRDIIRARFETGEPYLFFRDTINRSRPDCYVGNDLRVNTSQLCTEITLANDDDHTFVCCISSLNAARYDEWKGTDVVQLAIFFLDAVMEEFIIKTEGLSGFDRARRFAIKSRALGLGILGFHSYLQARMLPFDSLMAYSINRAMFSEMRREADKATATLSLVLGEPEWCRGYGRRNTHTLAVAPTVTNSILSGNVSKGIEPWAANAFTEKASKGVFFQKNKELQKHLRELDMDNDSVWNSIVMNDGSVQHLNLPDAIKEVFLTARELNQFVIVKLAAARQQYIDQTQSLNLFFPANADMKYVSNVHIEAWRSGVQTLYYLRTGAILKGDSGMNYSRSSSECSYCEG